MAFREDFVEADGFRIRYMEAGDGPALIHLHGAGGLRLSRAHDLLAQRHRVIAFEMPGFGNSPENTRSATSPEMAATMAAAVSALGIQTCNLWGTSLGAKVSLWLAIQAPRLVSALVLMAPAAIRPEDAKGPPSGSPEQMARLLYAHPDRMPPLTPPDPAEAAQTRRLVMRLAGPNRDADLEARMRALETPTLVVFGTHDRVIPPELGRRYKELLPNSHLAFVYDTAHRLDAERPEAFVEIAGDFLERHEAFVIRRTELGVAAVGPGTKQVHGLTPRLCRRGRGEDVDGPPSRTMTRGKDATLLGP